MRAQGAEIRPLVATAYEPARKQGMGALETGPFCARLGLCHRAKLAQSVLRRGRGLLHKLGQKKLREQRGNRMRGPHSQNPRLVHLRGGGHFVISKTRAVLLVK